MEQQFIDHINLNIVKPAPRTATLWRQWASQADISLANRNAISQDFSDYIYQEMGNREVADVTIKNITKALDSFWNLVDACPSPN